MWRRAPNYFDVVCYRGNATARTVNHALGVKPDMMWFKVRNTSSNWIVWHKDLASTTQGYHFIDQAGTEDTLSTSWNNSEPTATNFSLGTWSQVNGNNNAMVCFLFSSLSGICKVGSYSGNGGTSANGNGQDIDCGFTNGARFVLIKPFNAAEHTFLYDTQRGIVAGNDSTLLLNQSAAPTSSSDEIDPINSGFRVLNQNNQLNRTGRNYWFYAIA